MGGWVRSFGVDDGGRGARTVNMQSSLPKQSPVVQAAPPPFTPLRLLGPVPSALKEQFVLPHILPCQSALTHNCTLKVVSSSNPPVPGPMPFWVPMPGHMVSGQLFVTISEIGVASE